MRPLRLRLLLLVPLLTLVPPTTAAPLRAAEPFVWRTDYNAARKEAAEKGLPLCIVVGSDNCFYCRKLETGPLRDEAVVAQLVSNFVPLKINASTEPALAHALKIQFYPTTVLAGPDGRIHAFIEGYVAADRLLDNLKRTVTVTSTAEWAARDFEQAGRALAAGDYPRAVSLLRGIHREAGDKPIGIKARQLLEEVERQATGRLVRAQELEQRGLIQEALDLYAEAVKTYAGTQAAADAATRMTGLAARPETHENLRRRAARELLAAAREDFRRGRFYDCLQRCEQLTTAYPDLAEARDGESLAADIRSNPDRLAAACEQMSERTVALYLMLAESWAQRGQTAEALACFDKVARLVPNSPQAEQALARMAQLRGNGTARPASLRQP